jgi:hypothetical protein
MFMILGLLAACATTAKPEPASEKQSTTVAVMKRRAKKNRWSDQAPENYGIYRSRELDWKLLHKGQKAMNGTALD